MTNDSRTYATPAAFRQALEARLRRYAEEQGEELMRVRRQVAFDRLLARVFADRNGPWALKGGYALQLRFAEARTTRDVDLIVHGQGYKTRQVDDNLAVGYMALGISESVFADIRTVVHICDEELESIREVNQVDLGTRVVQWEARMCYNKGVTEEQAKAIAALYDGLSDEPDAPELTGQLLAKDGGFIVKLFTNFEGRPDDPQTVTNGILAAQELAQLCFNGKPVEFHFCGPFFETMLAVSSTDGLPAVVPATDCPPHPYQRRESC
jgi:hypothetical protein